jgi:hypothetical protein
MLLNWQFPPHLRQHSWKGFSSSSPTSFTRTHTFEVPLLDNRVYSSLASLQLEYFLLLNFISGRTVDTLAVVGWAGPLLPSESDMFAVRSKLAKLGCTACQNNLTIYFYLFYMLPRSHNCAQPFETNGLPFFVTRPDDASRKGPSRTSLARACPRIPLTGPIYRNLKIYRYILYRYTLYL